MTGPQRPESSRRRAVLIVAAVVVPLMGGLAAVIAAVVPAAPTASPAAGAAAPTSTARRDDGWDVTAEIALATRPMPVLPAAAALPHALSRRTTGPELRLPTPDRGGGLVARGFPLTAEGALAQLLALTRVGLAGGDPATYARAYGSVSGPGAPPVRTTPLSRGLDEVRSRAGLPATGAVPGLTFTWTPTSGLVKGTTDGGRFVVACVLGQLDVGAGGRTVSSAAGDCQSLRRVDDEWWIAPGPPAAPAPLAWPGSAEAAQVGYRKVARDAG